jgi:hypothetical protein
MARRLAILAWISVMGLAAARADDLDAAKAAYTRGRAAFEAGNFGEAVRQFEAAYGAAQAPEILWNIAQAHRRQYEIDHDLVHLRSARTVYGNFIELTPDDAERAEARRQLAAVDEQLRQKEPAREERPAPPPVVAPGAAPAPLVAPSVPPADAERGAGSPSLLRRWWLWTGVAVLLAAGAGVALALALPRDAAPMTSGGEYLPRF